MTARRDTPPAIFAEWVSALEARHLADLRVSEMTRALRALSATYVERRGTGVRGALDTAGKRAAFGLFYAPLHFLTTYLIVRALGADAPPPRQILDIGCGTGAAGAAWSTASEGAAVAGIDRHPWAVAEARWTYRQLGLRGRADQRDAAGKWPPVAAGTAVIAAYTLNEFPDAVRDGVLDRLAEVAGHGVRVLIIEPIARRMTPWWPAAASRLQAAGGRTDEWRFAVDLPPPLPLLDKAAGLDHRELTARSLYCPGAPREAGGLPVAYLDRGGN